MTTTPRTAPRTFTIRIDTREQNPFTFASVNMPVLPFSTVRATLKTGDYDLAEFAERPVAERVVVERKSLADLYGTLSRGRERFEREILRMAEYGYAAIVIEATYTEIATPNWHLPHATLMTSKSVIASLLAWSQRHGIHVFDCPGRRFAEQLTHRILERWARDHS